MSSSTDDEGKMKRFLFDQNDFDKKQAVEAPPSFTEEQLALAKKQSLTQGREEGIRETRASQEEQAVQCLEKIGEQVVRLMAAEERRETACMTDAAKLALRITHKLLPKLAQRFSLQEIEHTILNALEGRHDEPRVAVTVPTKHLDALRARIDGLALEKGFAGKVILVADDAMPETDCRVEWADGGAERIYARLQAQIDSEFAKAITGMEAMADEKQDRTKK